MKILEIDDNQDLLDLSELALTSVGHEFICADNGREGLELIQKQQFDVVLLDLSMPDFSGLDVLDGLDKNGILNKQKIVVFTASTPSEQEQKILLEKGVHSILSKPLDPDELIEHIEKINSKPEI
ncbi:MAG: response regulator [Nitrosopumilus sp.]|nr:response regulator [Nitrosopumilus sp.]MDH3793451.1 response regulator [Nitrosopumilus sp.]MDH3854497.1 response regulator [Nitrosopumilus sp.]